MKYDIIRQTAIYLFIFVTVAMTLLGVLAVWDLANEDVLWRAFSTVLVVGFGCVVIAYAASLLERRDHKEHLPSFAPPKSGPVPPPVPPPSHIAQNTNQPSN